MKTMKIIAAALLAATATFASGIGQAQAQPAAQTVAVHYGDLDLASPAGRDTLDHRLRQAVRTACGDPSPADLRGRNQAAECRADLTASLTARRDAAYAAAHSSRPLVLVARR